jgi:UDP-N-acetylglucosamine 2-epimerase (non-hydrolysing)
MKKILIVFGTRPEAIKMAPVVKSFLRNSIHFDTKVCVTAQHREMLDQVLNVFEISPDYDLNIMKSGQDLYDITSRVILGVRDVLLDFKPDIVFVHGDTTTSSITALAAYYQKIPVAHVEAGLRTHNIYSPWPEEINRQITSRIAEYNFAPTELSKQNLLKENIPEEHIYVTGNTVIDALQFVLKKINEDKEIKFSLIEKLNNQLLNKIDINTAKYILVTGHRRENFGKGFINICKALKEIALENKDLEIIYPVHLNPNVQDPVRSFLSGISNVHLIEPLDYVPFLYLMSKSYLVLTDSGGIQEEAPSLGKPVLVMRETTERPEAVKAGTVKLVGTDTKKIVNAVNELITDVSLFNRMSKASNPYGDGAASERITKIFLGKFNINEHN